MLQCVCRVVGGSQGQKWGSLAPEADWGLGVPLAQPGCRCIPVIRWDVASRHQGTSPGGSPHPSRSSGSTTAGTGWDEGVTLNQRPPHLIAHQRHHPSTMQRGQIPHCMSPAHLLPSPKHPQCLPRAESFLVLMILAAYSCPASTFTHLRTMEKAPLGTAEARGEGLGVGAGTAQPWCGWGVRDSHRHGDKDGDGDRC